MVTFEEWFKSVRDDVEQNCENRMDEYDAKAWMKEAWDARYKTLTYKDI